MVKKINKWAYTHNITKDQFQTETLHNRLSHHLKIIIEENPVDYFFFVTFKQAFDTVPK